MSATAPEEITWPSDGRQPAQILITVPHAFCQTPSSVCDRNDQRWAAALHHACQRLGIGGTMLLSKNPRSEADNNRRKASAGAFLRRMNQLLDSPAFANCFVVDAHSYPDDYTWGLETSPTLGIILRPYELSLDVRPVDALFSRRLAASLSQPVYRSNSQVEIVGKTRERSITFASLPGGYENYIMETAVLRGHADAILFEINDAITDAVQLQDLAELLLKTLIDARLAPAPAAAAAAAAAAE